MMKKTILFAAGTIGLLTCVTVAAAPPAPPPAAIVYDDAADGALAGGRMFGETSGEAMYRRVCAACHMPDAKGAVGGGHYPALAGNPKLAAAGYPTFVVVKGLNGMPPIGDMMTDQQVADTVNYVRTHFGNKYKDVVKAADVKALR
jgi:mono/diheme cytochrome c family protein